MPDREQSREGATWIHPPAEEEGLARYVTILRERAWIVVLAVLLTTSIGAGYALTADEVYEAESRLLVTPVSSDDPVISNLGLFQESANPAQPIETAATVVASTTVAEEAIDEGGLAISPRELLDRVLVRPVAESDVVAITAQAPTPEQAVALADSVAEAAVMVRTERLRAEVEELLPLLQSELRSQGLGGESREQLAANVAQLQTLARSQTPELRVEATADLPTAPVSPRLMLSVTGGLLAGLVLGFVAALALHALDPRLRREEQLRRTYGLPILARIPREPGSSSKAPLRMRELSPAAAEAYRALRGTLAARQPHGIDGSHAVLVTGSSAAEGKTTTALNLAASLTAAGRSVILIEADLRRPSIGPALGVTAKQGVVSVLIESVALEDALQTSPDAGARLKLLLADHEGGWISEVFSLPAARRLIDEARSLAEYVIIDSPPLTDVIDALPLVDYVDDVLIVARPGRTDVRKLLRLGEILAENGTRPAGFALVGVSRRTIDSTYYHESTSHPGGPGGRTLRRSRPGARA